MQCLFIDVFGKLYNYVCFKWASLFIIRDIAIVRLRIVVRLLERWICRLVINIVRFCRLLLQCLNLYITLSQWRWWYFFLHFLQKIRLNIRILNVALRWFILYWYREQLTHVLDFRSLNPSDVNAFICIFIVSLNEDIKWSFIIRWFSLNYEHIFCWNLFSVDGIVGIMFIQE